MACGCSKNRATASGVAKVSGTYRVMVNGRQAYETSSSDAATEVAKQFTKSADVKILAPGETA